MYVVELRGVVYIHMKKEIFDPNFFIKNQQNNQKQLQKKSKTLQNSRNFFLSKNTTKHVIDSGNKILWTSSFPALSQKSQQFLSGYTTSFWWIAPLPPWASSHTQKYFILDNVAPSSLPNNVITRVLNVPIKHYPQSSSFNLRRAWLMKVKILLKLRREIYILNISN